MSKKISWIALWDRIREVRDTLEDDSLTDEERKYYKKLLRDLVRENFFVAMENIEEKNEERKKQLALLLAKDKKELTYLEKAFIKIETKFNKKLERWSKKRTFFIRLLPYLIIGIGLLIFGCIMIYRQLVLLGNP